MECRVGPDGQITDMSGILSPRRNWSTLAHVSLAGESRRTLCSEGQSIRKAIEGGSKRYTRGSRCHRKLLVSRDGNVDGVAAQKAAPEERWSSDRQPAGGADWTGF